MAANTADPGLHKLQTERLHGHQGDTVLWAEGQEWTWVRRWSLSTLVSNPSPALDTKSLPGSASSSSGCTTSALECSFWGLGTSQWSPRPVLSARHPIATCRLTACPPTPGMGLRWAFLPSAAHCDWKCKQDKYDQADTSQQRQERCVTMATHTSVSHRVSRRAPCDCYRKSLTGQSKGAAPWGGGCPGRSPMCMESWTHPSPRPPGWATHGVPADSPGAAAVVPAVSTANTRLHRGTSSPAAATGRPFAWPGSRWYWTLI